MSDGKTFEYGGYHFTPYRQFERRDGGNAKITRNLRSDFSMGLCTYAERKKFDYTHDNFYAASTDKQCSIFRCTENGLLYVPGLNELFIYNEPRQRQSVKAALESTKDIVLANKSSGQRTHGAHEQNGGER